jgi:hypothetical protein
MLCSVIQPEEDTTMKRHDIADVNHADSRLTRYAGVKEDGETVMVEERKGIHHIVEGWEMLGHRKKVCSNERSGGGDVPLRSTYVPRTLSITQGLFLSSAFTKSSQGLGGIMCYYRATWVVSEILRRMFKRCFPEEYVDMEKAFLAGQWVPMNPGPWLGRAVVYKLQGLGHFDDKDKSPTASFPCGSFQGGDMVVPQLGARFG